MEIQKIKELFDNFLSGYDMGSKDNIWEIQSKQFRDFWETKIIHGPEEDLDAEELDQIIKILDRNGKGNTSESEAVARAMIPQGAWRRMFNEIKSNKELSGLLNQIFIELDDNKKADLIDKVYKFNEDKRNHLTGPSGNAINAMLAAYDPVRNLSVISLKDRKKVFEYFKFDGSPDFDNDSVGKKMIISNSGIVSGFNNTGFNYSARTLSVFLYSVEVKLLWKVVEEDDYAPWGGFKELVEKTEPEVNRTLNVKSKSKLPVKKDWIPPIISDLQELALNQETEWSKSMNIKPERAFEIKLGYAFRILGYEVEDLGQGKGREPDGIAYSTDANSDYYAIVYDAKATERDYSIGTEDRKISEYIKKYQKELQKRRVKKFSFLIVSSEFSKNQSLDNSIKDIYKETRCPVVLMRADDLLSIVAHKLSHEGIDHSVLENLFLSSGIVASDAIEEILG
jgi:hypothetical protein